MIDSVTITRDYPLFSAMPQSSPLHLPANAGSSGNAGAVPGHSTAIILDEANSYFENAASARKSVLDLIGKAPPDERIALYVIVRRRGLILLQDYTTDRDALRRSLAGHTPSGSGDPQSLIPPLQPWKNI